MVFDESPLKDAYRWLVWGPYRGLMERAPSAVEVRVNRRLGYAMSRAMRGERRILEERLRSALGERVDVARIASECFATHFANQYVGFGFQKVTVSNLVDYVRFEGLEHVRSALEHGGGVVLAHPHMGLPQMALHGMGLLGFDVHQVGGGHTAVELSTAGARAAALRGQLEGRICATMHDGQAYLRPLLRALTSNGVVFTACDGTGGGIELGRRRTVQVLERAFAMPVFPVWLCEQTRATPYQWSAG